MELLWQRVLFVGFVGVALSAVSPEVAPVAGSLAAIAFIVLGGKRIIRDAGPARSAWLAILAGISLMLFGGLWRAGESAVSGVAYPFPSVADAAYILGYMLNLVGAMLFVSKRTREKRSEDFVDAIAMALLVALFLYFVGFGSYLQDGTVAPIDRLVNLIYFLLTPMMAAATARVSFGPGERNGSYYLLAATAFQVVLVDTLIMLDLGGHSWAQRAVPIVAAGAFVAMAACISHPGAMRLADRPLHEKERLGNRRVVLLLVALCAGPSGLALSSSLSSLDRFIVLGLSLGLATCVVIRTVFLVLSRERRADQEESLRELGSALVAAQDSENMMASAMAVLDQVLIGLPNADAAMYHHKGAILSRTDTRTDARVRSTLVLDQLDLSLQGGIVAKEGGTYEDIRFFQSDLMSSYVALAPILARRQSDLYLIVTSSEVIPREHVAAIKSFAGQLGLALDSLEAAEEAHQRRFRALVESSSDILIVVDRDGTIRFVSPNVERMLDYSEDALLNRPLSLIVDSTDRSRMERLLQTAYSSKGEAEQEMRLVHGSGEPYWFQVEARDLTDSPEIGGLLLTARDVSERKRAETKLLRSESRFRLMVQHASDVVLVVDDNNMVSYISPSIHKMLGMTVEEVLGRNVYEMLSVTEAERIRAITGDDPERQSLDVRIQASDGTVRALEVSITDMRDEPDVAGMVLSLRDVSERRRLEDSLRHQALHDDLTGLANRTLFTDRVRDALIADAELRAVLFIDLDDFKLINDSLGHEVGDQVLVTVADRIQQCLRLTDTAARLGGDEFAILINSVYGESEVAEIASRIRESISEPITIEGHSLRMTASIGVALASDQRRSGEDLLRSADLAMYQAKHAGKDRVETFQHHMEVTANEQLGLKTALLRAVENEEFVLHYQPIFDVNHGISVGVEALIRWEDPERGLVSPASFIGVAEESGLIGEIGRWVAGQAMADLAEWQAMGLDLYCTINVSGKQFQDPNFADTFLAQIHDAGVNPSQIVVELTESLLAAPNTAESFKRLHEVGVRIALDDFGTGFSALSYLQNFDIDLIKIDRSFVTALGETGDPGVVQAVLDVARSIGATTVAEGIEHTAELHQLKELGVELGQGYYFAKPLPKAQLRDLLISERAGSRVPLR